MIHDVAVIGAGLIGTAAAKYLSSNNCNTVLIGPSSVTTASQGVFSSHEDHSRVARHVGKDDVWTHLNIASLQSIQSLQVDNSEQIFFPTGCLYVNPYGMDSHLNQLEKKNKNFGLTGIMSLESYNERFGHFNFRSGSRGFYESLSGGYINPLVLLKRQIELYQKWGGVYVDDVVLNFQEASGSFRLKCSSGGEILAEKLLFAMGAYANSLSCVPNFLKTTIKSETVMLASLPKTDRLKWIGMPSLLYELDEDYAEGVYLIPPHQLPDGNYYIKIGCNMPEDIFFTDYIQVRNWFEQGATEQQHQTLKKILNDILPSCRPVESFTKRCIITRTAHGNPYIDHWNDEKIALACGGNGYGAMCSDELGRLAACLIMDGDLPKPYKREYFKVEQINDISCF